MVTAGVFGEVSRMNERSFISGHPPGRPPPELHATGTMADVPSLTFRAATAHDVDELLEFWTRAAENDARPTDRPDLVVQLVARDPEALLLAVEDGRIVGTVISGWDGWRAHLYRLAVDPARRGRGIAGQLLDRAEERLRALGAQRLDAMVLDGNDLGASLWRARGYAPQPEWSRWVKPAQA